MRYTVKGTNIKHGGKVYREGSVIELDKIKNLEKFLVPCEEVKPVSSEEPGKSPEEVVKELIEEKKEELKEKKKGGLKNGKDQ